MSPSQICFGVFTDPNGFPPNSILLRRRFTFNLIQGSYIASDRNYRTRVGVTYARLLTYGEFRSLSQFDVSPSLCRVIQTLTLIGGNVLFGGRIKMWLS